MPRQAVADRPSLIITKSHIAYGSPNKQDTAEAHGSPLGADEIRLTKIALGLPPDEQFWVPDEVYARYGEAKIAGGKVEAAWDGMLAGYAAADPEAVASLKQALSGELPAGWDADLPVVKPGDKVATRSASGKVLATRVRVGPACADRRLGRPDSFQQHPAERRGGYQAG